MSARPIFRLILITVLTTGLTCTSVGQKKYILLLSGGKSGINLDNGTRVLPPQYEKLGWSDGKFEVINGIIGFQKAGSWGIISLKGEIITPAIFNSLLYTGTDLIEASVKKEDGIIRYGYIDLTGKTIIPFEYDHIKIIRDRIIIASNEAGVLRYGMTDIRFRSLIARMWRSITPVNDQYFLVENDKGQKAVYDLEGNRKTTFLTDSVRSYGNGTLMFYQGPMAGIVDPSKADPQNALYKSIRITDKGVTEVLHFNRWVLLNEDNKIIDKIDADSIRLLPDETILIYRNGFVAVVSSDFNMPGIAEFKPAGKIGDKPKIKKGLKGTGLADENGRWLIKPEYDSLSWDGKVAVTVLRFEDGTSETRIIRPLTDGWTSPAYEYIQKMDSYFNFRKYGRYGLADQHGNEIIPAVYDSLLSIKDKSILVVYQGKYGLMDFKQKWIEMPQPGQITHIDETHYIIQLPNNFRLKNIEGKMLYSSPYPLILNTSGTIEEHIPGGIKKCLQANGNPCPEHSNKSGLKTTKEKITVKENTELIDSQPLPVFPETEGLKGFYDNGKFGFRDSKNRIRIANRYDSIRPFREGKAAIKLLGKWGFINTEDKIVVQPLYSQTTDFSDGTARVRKDGKWGMINDQGLQVLKPVYDRMIRQEGTENFIITADALYGVVSGSGRLLIEPKYQYLEPALGDRYLVKSEFYGVVNSAGEPIFPMNYKQLFYFKKRNAFLTEEKEKWTILKQ